MITDDLLLGKSLCVLLASLISFFFSITFIDVLFVMYQSLLCHLNEFFRIQI